jgi:hypothetical protein
MIFERLFLLFLLVPPVLWMMFHSHRTTGSNRFLLKASGAALLLFAFCLPDLFVWESRAAANVLAER